MESCWTWCALDGGSMQQHMPLWSTGKGPYPQNEDKNVYVGFGPQNTAPMHVPVK